MGADEKTIRRDGQRMEESGRAGHNGTVERSEGIGGKWWDGHGKR